MNDAEEAAYIQGERAAFNRILGLIVSELGLNRATVEGLIREREATIDALRSLCREFGDNDWPSDLWLPDIIRKHLENYLHDRSP